MEGTRGEEKEKGGEVRGSECKRGRARGPILPQVDKNRDKNSWEKTEDLKKNQSQRYSNKAKLTSWSLSTNNPSIVIVLNDPILDHNFSLISLFAGPSGSGRQL